MMRGLLIVLLACYLPLAEPQTSVPPGASPEAQLSPQEAYERAIRPLEITRRSPQNWSEVELKALKLARESAKTECLARSPENVTGADRLALAHLCAFAEQWESVHWAASDYIAAAQNSNGAGSANSPVDLATAFDYKIQSSLNLKNVEEAIADCQTMVRTVPYDVFTSEATNSTIDAIRFTHMDVALALLNQRQPIVLSLMQAHESPSHDATNAKPPTPIAGPPALPLHTLYADAIALASLQQFANQEKAAADSFAQVESALPAHASQDESMYIEEQRRQYRLLGQHLPTMNPMGSLLFLGAASPQGINTVFANGAVFLLFPDWCNQCIAMGQDATQKNKELADHKVSFFLLMAQADPPEKPAPPPVKSVPLSAKGAKASVAQGRQIHFDQQVKVTSEPDTLLLGTPTVVVPDETLNTFAASDFPLIIATDHNGIVRWIERAPQNALDSEGEVDQIVTHILTTWPPG